MTAKRNEEQEWHPPIVRRVRAAPELMVRPTADAARRWQARRLKSPSGAQPARLARRAAWSAAHVGAAQPQPPGRPKPSFRVYRVAAERTRPTGTVTSEATPDVGQTWNLPGCAAEAVPYPRLKFAPRRT